MNNDYGEFQGTELDPSLDLDLDDEQDDIIPILGLAAFVAAVVGAILVLLGRRRKPTTRERLEDMLAAASKEGKRGTKKVAKAVEDANLGDMLDEAIKRARKATNGLDLDSKLSDVKKRASGAARDVDLASLLAEARDKAGKVGSAGKSLGLASLLDEALSKAQDAGKRVDLSGKGDDARDLVGKIAAKATDVNVNTGDVSNFLASLRDKVAETIETVRKDMAPKVGDKLKDDVLPAAQAAVETVTRKVKEDVLPGAQDASGKLRESVAPIGKRIEEVSSDHDMANRAKKVVSVARDGATSFGDILRTIGLAVAERVIDDVLPGVKKAGGKAVQAAREDAIPAAAQTAGDAAQHLRKDVLPKVGEVAARTPDLLSEILGIAREKVEEAIDNAQPVASNAAQFTRHRAGNVASAARAGGSGVGGALSSARDGVTGAVGGAVHATTHATRETAATLFWLTALGGLITAVFVPERDKQKELYNNVLQFLGEVREMWHDLQGPDYDPEPSSHKGTV